MDEIPNFTTPRLFTVVMAKLQCFIFVFILLLVTSMRGQELFTTQPVSMTEGHIAHSSDRADFTYDIQLLPGQQFSGYIYHWSQGDVSTGDLHENPEVNWLSVSPTSFTVEGCDKPFPVMFTFTAPTQTGTYKTTVEDWNFNWSDNQITLTVTSKPTLNTTDSILIIQGPGSIYYRYKTHEYHGIVPSQDWINDGYCGADPYVVSTTRNIIHGVYPANSRLTFNPISFTISLDEIKTVTKRFEVTKNEPDSFYESLSLQWLSYPRFIKWKLIPADYLCLNWEEIPPLNVPCIHSGAEVYKSNIFLMGGYNPLTNSYLDRVERYDGMDWTVSSNSLNEPRSDFGHAVMDDRIYVFGGRGDQLALKSMEYYNGSQWVAGPEELPGPLYDFSGAVYDNCYFTFGGRYDEGYTLAVWRYSRLKGWDVLPDTIPFSPRSGYCCVQMDTSIYIIGGAYYRIDPAADTTYYADVIRYDPIGHKFFTLNPLNRARAGFACGIVDSMIYVVGGRSGDPHVASSVEFLDPASGTWLTCNDAPDISFLPAASVVKDNLLYLMGGSITGNSDTTNYRDCYGSSILNGNSPEPPPVPAPTVIYLPNPMQDLSYLSIDLPYDSHVNFRLFDLSGRLVATIADKYLQANTYRFPIEGWLLAEGLYLGVLKTEKHTVVKKLVKIGD